jgi:3'-phosphoadenosine 5'-phosphosulfate sulfotransferase (PAPS reductase)/FAD synthetase
MNPYLIDRPATISFSGGRTSGFMLAKIVEAYGGTLPDDVIPCFQNTGLEHPATLEFVRECGERTGVKIRWLEYRRTEEEHTFEEVTFESASRNGEPFTQVVAARGHLPNPVTRICTVNLKMRTLIRFTRSLGWGQFTNAIGLRADEPRRVARMKGDIKAESVVMPLAEAGQTIADVRAYWKERPFDLRLPNDDHAYGNCVGCFLKGKDKLMRLMREAPEHFDWWIETERNPPTNGTASVFRSDRPTYAQMMQISKSQGFLFDEEDTLPCFCTE